MAGRMIQRRNQLSRKVQIHHKYGKPPQHCGWVRDLS